MNRRPALSLLILLFCLILLVACADTPAGTPTTTAPSPAGEGLAITSPDGRLETRFWLDEAGAPYYQVTRDGQPVIQPSRMGFVLADRPLNSGFAISGSQTGSFDDTWEQPWGEVQFIRNQYNELRVDLQERGAEPRQMTIRFRLYDDGLGFRYEWPEQPHLAAFEIMDESTEFVLSGDHQAWWIPAYLDNRYEFLYKQTSLSSLNRPTFRAMHTPVTMATADGLFLTIHEASLVDFASMTLAVTGDTTLKADLVPWSDGVLVRASAPHRSPWRTIQIADSAAGLLTSHLILNLNEPNRLADISWTRPGKYIGIWWGMHLDTYTWGSGPQHGATTANTQAYMDFAARYGFDGVLVEGWNVGWDGDWFRNGENFQFTTPYDDFDIAAVTAYGRELGVALIGHHETGAAVLNYEAQLPQAFAYYQDLGVHLVKTGYVGAGQSIKRIDEATGEVVREWHHGQFMVRHYQYVAELAAEYQIMLDIHEPIKDTGLRRTYPNMMTREGARGMEYNAWSADGGNPPEHETILPFTRMMAGPMDFTPGIFDLLFAEARPGNRVNTTLAKQLALYVVLYSPWQMAADLPANYEGQPAFQFILDVPVDWRDTQVLHAQIGDYVTYVRQDRGSEDWYLGSVTDEEARVLEAPLTFLTPGVTYVAEIYADDPAGDWQTNPLALTITQMLVDSETLLTLRLAAGGGQAIRFRPATPAELAP